MKTGVQCLKAYLESDGGRKLELAELKALSEAERIELGALSSAALGLKPSVTADGKTVYV